MTTRASLGRGMLIAGVLGAAGAATGCEHVKPWERGRLAHPTMVRDTSGPAEDHVNAVQEGAAGGASGAASGCGCN